MESTLFAAFSDELEKLGVRAISRPKGSRIKALFGKLRGRSPELAPPHKYQPSPGMGEEGMSQWELKRKYHQQLSPEKETGLTTGGAPKTRRDIKAALARLGIT